MSPPQLPPPLPPAPLYVLDGEFESPEDLMGELEGGWLRAARQKERKNSDTGIVEGVKDAAE